LFSSILVHIKQPHLGGEFDMDKRNTGIIATVASVILCGCPGIGFCLFGALTAAGQDIFNNGSLSPTVGIVLLCVSLIFIAIPIVVGFVTLRKKPEEVKPITDEPLPPTT
jgi:preprotein translocase subunit SecF